MRCANRASENPTAGPWWTSQATSCPVGSAAAAISFNWGRSGRWSLLCPSCINFKLLVTSKIQTEPLDLSRPFPQTDRPAAGAHRNVPENTMSQ